MFFFLLRGYFKTLAHFGQLSLWTKAPISIELIVKNTLKCQNQSIWSDSLELIFTYTSKLIDFYEINKKDAVILKWSTYKGWCL